MRDLYRMFMDAGYDERRVEAMQVWQAAHLCTPEAGSTDTAVAFAGARSRGVSAPDPRANPVHGGAIAAALAASRRTRAEGVPG